MSLTVGSRCHVWHSNSRQSFWRGSILEEEVFGAKSLESDFSSDDVAPAAEVDASNVAGVVLFSTFSLPDGFMLKVKDNR